MHSYPPAFTGGQRMANLENIHSKPCNYRFFVTRCNIKLRFTLPEGHYLVDRDSQIRELVLSLCREPALLSIHDRHA